MDRRLYILIKPTNDFASSEDVCKKALAIFEKLGYAQAYSHVYESRGDVYLTQQEWVKARLFLDQLGEGLVKPEKGIPPNLLQKKTKGGLNKNFCRGSRVTGGWQPRPIKESPWRRRR